MKLYAKTTKHCRPDYPIISPLRAIPSQIVFTVLKIQATVILQVGITSLRYRSVRPLQTLKVIFLGCFTNSASITTNSAPITTNSALITTNSALITTNSALITTNSALTDKLAIRTTFGIILTIVLQLVIVFIAKIVPTITPNETTAVITDKSDVFILQVAIAIIINWIRCYCLTE